jgi:hypothetical protein
MKYQYMLDTFSSFANTHPLSSYLIVVFICSVISYPLRMLVGRLRFVYVLPVAIGFYLAHMAQPYMTCPQF